MKPIKTSAEVAFCFSVAGTALAFGFFYFFVSPSFARVFYEVPVGIIATTTPRVTHRDTPRPLKAVYMTSWVSGNKTLREKIAALIDSTELNAVVVDIKDYSGAITFPVNDPVLRDLGHVEGRIPDVVDFIKELHERGIYVIGRIAVFQDAHMVKVRPDLAVRTKSGEVWKDFKNISWIDAAAEEYWEYIVRLAEESYDQGFDELNFDYIRFPSDGNMNDIAYPLSGSRLKQEVMRNFFSYLDHKLRRKGIPISADFFGMTTTNPDDLNIGQVLEDGLPHFDYIAPMVYPSHYPKGFMGFDNPAVKPYEVVKYSLDKAMWRASTTPEKIRPWLQDFDLGAIYTADMVRAEIRAAYDAGFDSWMIWDPANTYTRGALLDE